MVVEVRSEVVMNQLLVTSKIDSVHTPTIQALIYSDACTVPALLSIYNRIMTLSIIVQPGNATFTSIHVQSLCISLGFRKFSHPVYQLRSTPSK